MKNILLMALILPILLLAACGSPPAETITVTAPPITVTPPTITITQTVTQTQIATPTITTTPPPTIEEGIVAAMLYPSITIGGFVHQLGYSLTNGSSQTITVTKVEFFDMNGSTKHSVSESTIQGASHQGQLLSGNTFNWSVSFQIPYSTEEIEGWQVNWYCLDANGQEFIVEG